MLDPGRFDEFWSAYPRKVGKQKARTKFAAATKRASSDAVIAGAQRLAADPNLPPEQYVPHPSTWLERNGWEDPPLPPRHDRPAQLVGGLDADGWAAMHANAVAHASERTPR